MNINRKYIKCFNQKKSAELNNAGFSFLFEQNGVYYHQSNELLIAKFSEDDNSNISNILKGTKQSLYIPI